MAEKRRFARIARSLVTYYRRLDEVTPPRAAVTRDLSTGGVLVHLEGIWKAGDLLTLELVLDKGQAPVDLIGRVARVDERGVGIEFVQLEENESKTAGVGIEILQMRKDDSARLTRFIEERVMRESKAKAGDGG